MRLAFVLLVFVSLSPRLASAQPERVLVYAPDDGVTTRRLHAEIRAIGVEVEARSGPDRGPDIALATRDAGAVAAVVLRADRAEIWVADATETTVRSIAQIAPSEDEELLVLRTVEHLHAALIEVHEAADDRRADAEVPPEPREPADVASPEAASRSAPWTLELTGSAGGAPEGVAAVGWIGAAVEWRIDRWLALSATVDVPLVPLRVEADEGSSEHYLGVGALAARVPFLDESEPVQPWLGVGVGLGLVASSGRPASGFISSDSVLALGQLRVELGLRAAVTQ